MSNSKDLKSKANQQRARLMKRAEILEWYLASSGGIPPKEQCEDRKSYRGKVIWFLDPPIPFTENPVLIEEYLGDAWTLRTEIRIT